MPIFLEKTNRYGDKTYTRLGPLERSSVSQHYNYNFKDSVTEQHRQKENKQSLSYVAQKLKKMRVEARNGFKDVPGEEQLEIIIDRKININNILTETGSFFITELKKNLIRCDRIVDKIYAPFLNQSSLSPSA